MPTPRSHGGAELSHVPLNLPAFLGLNKQAAGAILGPEWATKLNNTILDQNNRLAARNGWDIISDTGSGFSGQIVQLFEYQTHAGAFELLATDETPQIRNSSDDGFTWADVSGSATLEATGNIQFVNFNDAVFGWQQGGSGPVQYSGTTFSNLTGTDVPTGDAAVSAFGRIWAVDSNGTDVRYCSLLDASDWEDGGAGDAGVIALKNVWTGTDTVVALAEFNNQLVVFGKENIVIWNDGTGSELGIDPTQIQVVDTIEGIGCIARDSVQNIDGDLWFLSNSGVHSLGRLTREKSNPLKNLSQNVQDDLRIRLNQTTVTNIRSVYSPIDRFYLLSLPSTVATQETGVAYCFDTRGVLDNGSTRCVGIWDEHVPRAVFRTNDLTLVSFIMQGLPATVNSSVSETSIGVYGGLFRQ